MKMKNMLWAALSMTAALVMTACSSNDDNMTETPVAPSTSKTIPYTVTVGGDVASTRATVADDNKTLKFASGDQLYITGTNIKGVLEIQDGIGSASNATFSGTLTYSGSGSPADNLALTATLVSVQQTVGTQVSVDGAGAVTVNYPTTAYCSSINDAVQKYSNLTGTSTYGAKAFTLTQQTAFLNFVITFDDGTATNTTLSAVVSNGGAAICTANVTTVTDDGIKAKFVLPVAAGTTLSSATVTMGSKTAISFGASQTLTGKVYNVKKNIVNLSTLNANYEAQNGDVLTGTLGGAYAVSIADGASVTLKDVDINSNGAYFANYDGIGCAGDATITLEGTNKVRALGARQSGIGVGNNKTLIIQGSGSLEVWGSGMGAGIGGNIDGTCGNITIKSGTIIARGGTSRASAGIGGGSGRYCGVITISGGDVTAIGGAGGAGIGSADGAVSCNGITISGGTINATGSNGAAGIGCGSNSNCGDISISGGTITATGGIYAAGIGGSAGEKSVGICGKITITGGKITATGGDASAGIGGGWGCGDITISGAKINSTKGSNVYNSIGKCNNGVGGTVTIDGTLYWDGSTYTNGGYAYLTQSPLKINWDTRPGGTDL